MVGACGFLREGLVSGFRDPVLFWELDLTPVATAGILAFTVAGLKPGWPWSFVTCEFWALIELENNTQLKFWD